MLPDTTVKKIHDLICEKIIEDVTFKELKQCGEYLSSDNFMELVNERHLLDKCGCPYCSNKIIQPNDFVCEFYCSLKCFEQTEKFRILNLKNESYLFHTHEEIPSFIKSEIETEIVQRKLDVTENVNPVINTSVSMPQKNIDYDAEIFKPKESLTVIKSSSMAKINQMDFVMLNISPTYAERMHAGKFNKRTHTLVTKDHPYELLKNQMVDGLFDIQKHKIIDCATKYQPDIISFCSLCRFENCAIPVFDKNQKMFLAFIMAYIYHDEEIDEENINHLLEFVQYSLDDFHDIHSVMKRHN
eukprot:TRINITY_DN332_c0_g1_i1.p1 TRINITY_DN332_c0_g1~~TRINITY_DN332_c0_g1_i1.p1  ORF type:complete len:300 (+),score=70.80 TRINITY_DN332_c0_g1_i1:34-933(+)